MSHDLRHKLRVDTARMLRVDLSNLTPAQEVRLSRAIVLRLELDDFETKKLNGQKFDLKDYVVASESLERLMGSDPERPSSEVDFTGAREELLRFLDGRAAALERRDQRRAHEQANRQPPPIEPPVQPAPSPGPPLHTPAAVLAPPAVAAPLPNNVTRLRPVSETTRSFFANAPGATNTGFRRFDPPRGW